MFSKVDVVVEESEFEFMNKIVEIVRMYDFDILIGYEVYGGLWGYVVERVGR